MKKSCIRICSVFLCFIFCSWGEIGHYVIAAVAERHLTLNTRAAVKTLLGDKSLTDVASWADEVRRDPIHRKTASLHFINLPLGLTYRQFSEMVKYQGYNNLYGALLKYTAILKDSSTTKEQKTEALKFIVHFVGDAHQPMHVSRKEDKGGNTIHIQFEDKSTNLHALWDKGLINEEGLNSDQMVNAYDKASSEQIKTWQSDIPMQWLWESYQISTKLYTEVESDNKLKEDYFNKHIGIVHQRLEKAGIRLAGVLNSVF